MDIQKIKELALANGFKLKEKADGSMDLNAYVYDFANAIEREAKAQSEKALLEQFEINNKLVEQIEKLKAKTQAIPDGFVLVTKEPNLEFKGRLRSYLDNLWMGEWGCDWDGFICVSGIDPNEIWQFMIEAQEPVND